MNDFPQRQPIRLTNFDYGSNGAYFITICVNHRKELLGKIDVGAILNRPYDVPSQIDLSKYGAIVELAIKKIPDYSDTLVDKYVIMPNHIHILLSVNNDSENGRLRIAPTVNISVTIQQFKRRISKQIGFSLWQKSFYDHIIRDEEDYQIHLKYIEENPAKWAEDEYYGGGS
ncbi:MAG TPA: transposase [Oscillospiraceae bacterium]|nr:transposase [Oscillospiraceae bacterium]HPF56029.1 transposase [Clostridiales bacterium]HPK35519.1 transposase [Oscillospiraceae bacterium]HPR75654.1 transposase [Oscillospiraceae bacterium]